MAEKTKGDSGDVKSIVQKIFDKCAGVSGCDVCREHIREDCLFFPELFRMSDEIIECDGTLDTRKICKLLALCTMCGLCPCRDIRMLILRSKAAAAEEQGLILSSKVLSDAESIGRLGTRFPGLVNAINGTPLFSHTIKKMLRISDNRRLPLFPKYSFFHWESKRNREKPERAFDKPKQTRKIAYFVGCSAGYIYPDVGSAAVSFLEKAGVEVYVPTQQCCGMPLLMEGRKKKAFDKIQANVDVLMQSIRDGYQVVCSCPTCGYFFKKLLLEKAFYSHAAQKRLKSENNVIQVPLGAGKSKLVSLSKTIYGGRIKDDGFFSSIDPLDRIEISQNVKDLGEYLLSLQLENEVAFKIEAPEQPMLYFAPCHQREQGIDQPYFQMISSIPGVDIISVGGPMDCCGMGGHLGYKASFQQAAAKIGHALFAKIAKEKHRTVITDCLSCRMQFEQKLSMAIRHPVELFTLSSL